MSEEARELLEHAFRHALDMIDPDSDIQRAVKEMFGEGR